MQKKNNVFFHLKKSTIATLIMGVFITSAYAETYKLRIGAGHPVQGIAHVTAVQDFFMPEVNKHFSAKLFAYDNNLNQGDIIKIQILKFANRVHPIYGKLLIDQKYFDNLIANFKNNVSDDEIPINMEHDRTKAQARMKNVYQEGDFLFCDAELTKD